MSERLKTETYHKVKRNVYYMTLVIDVLLLISLSASGLSLSLKMWAEQFSHNPVIINAVYLLVFSLGIYVFHFPFHFFLGYYWEHRYQLSNQNTMQWLIDELKQTILSFALILLLIEFIYIFLGQFPQTWWIYAGMFWLIVSLVIARILPNVLIPIFYKYVPIENEELKKRINQQFEQCHVDLDDIYAINLSSKTKKANAFVCGLGKKRRVVLTDTLLSNFSDAEIEAVVAHELGHYCNKDIIKLIAVNTIVVLFGLYLASHGLVYIKGLMGLSSIADIALLPGFLLIMMIFSFLTSPLLNGFSRWIERDADDFSLKMTKNPDGFVTMMQKLGEINLAEMSPSRFNEIMFFDHPPISKRIAFAENFKGHSGGASS